MRDMCDDLIYYSTVATTPYTIYMRDMCDDLIYYSTLSRKTFSLLYYYIRQYEKTFLATMRV
jgi:hypothetical protein